ncbi:MAG: J domain-containing protein [Deltaproteobacteria bacterium]|nr:J domain-containing protein [Deltaproteobacteria bacterium]
MSREQANTYRKFRSADDAKGNLGWAAGMNKKGMRIAPETPDGVPTDFEFSIREKALWELMRIARVYTDLENARLLPPEEIRAFVRGLIAADMLDILDAQKCKNLVPLEVKRAVAKVKGKSPGKGKGKKKKSRSRARVFRPDISGNDDAASETQNETSGDAQENAEEKTPEANAASSSSKPKAQSKAAKLSSDDQKRKTVLVDAYKAMKTQNHYDFFGLKDDADTKAIKSSYIKKARELHPDNIAGTALAENEKLVEMADRLFKRLQEAHQVLTSVGERKEYDAELARSGVEVPVKSSGKVKRPREAQLAFRKAEVFFNKKEFKQADQYYKLALEFDPDVDAYKLAHIWCQYFDERVVKSMRCDKAKADLIALFDSKKMAEAAYKLGLMARIEENENEAVKWFKKTLSVDKKHAAAKQEKRLWEMRARKETEEKKKNERGVFGKLFRR